MNKTGGGKPLGPAKGFGGLGFNGLGFWVGVGLDRYSLGTKVESENQSLNCSLYFPLLTGDF